ncbi:hypothetical protein PaG_03197 [Moesziomyces aphidis]|uniref:Uncharacterized protein n=1 Tax=Moesziomyces aphidis TaxID=84754 RepID=W3VP46_MOEAP|nr:hypothetical protein PaG_03197 [Moesziomyces aphidis]
MAALMLSRLACWLLFAAISVQLAWCAGDFVPARHGQDASSSSQLVPQTFAEKYRIIDPVSGRPWSELEYKHFADQAIPLIDGVKYYKKNWRLFRTVGADKIRHVGVGATPADLLKHPYYVDYSMSGSHIPALSIRVADMLPHNPMSLSNPDVVIFMHSISVDRQTDAKFRLEPRFVVRGSAGQGRVPETDGPAHNIKWQKRQPWKPEYVWVEEVPEIFRSEALRSIEALGYPPLTIDGQVALLDRESSVNLYAAARSSKLADLLEQSRLYMFQFVPPQAKGTLESYGLMRLPIDGNREAWFQGPLFDRFDPLTGHIQLKMYTSMGKRTPVLDRVMYTMSQQGRYRLVPRAIVRPTGVYPNVHFKTIYAIPPELQQAASVDLSYMPDLDRPVPTSSDLDRPLRVMMDRPRPLGHPLDYAASHLFRLPTNGNKALWPGAAGQRVARQTDRSDEPGMLGRPTQNAMANKIDEGVRLSSAGPRRLPHSLHGAAPQQDSPGVPATPGESPEVEMVDSLAANPQVEHHQAFHPPVGPLRSEEFRAHPPAPPRHSHHQPQYFDYKPGRPNPYELPRDSPIDVLMAHLEPDVEETRHFFHT